MPNLKLMTQFYREYPGLFEIGQQPVADIHTFVRTLSWTVNILLIQKVKDLEIRKWYMHACIEQGWGRDILAVMIKSNVHDRQGAAVTNFDAQLPETSGKILTEIHNNRNVTIAALSERIRDIRSAEKVFRRNVQDIYATSIDYFETVFDGA